MTEHPDPEDWKARVDGMGTCFHRALSRWVQFHRKDSAHGFRIGVGVIRRGINGTRIVHAWLEREHIVMSAVDGRVWDKDLFYIAVGIEANTVRLVNPRKFMRNAKVIDRTTVEKLLRAWGGEFQVNKVGGVEAS